MKVNYIFFTGKIIDKMIDKSSLLKSQGSLYLELIPKDGLFYKTVLLSLMGFETG